MRLRPLLSILIVVMLCIATSRILYFGFTPKYGPLIYSKEAFHHMFDHDVFKYRILSQYLLFALDNWMEQHLQVPHSKETILPTVEAGSEHFYYAFYYLNTFFLCLASIVMVLLLELKQVFQLADTEKYLLLFLFTLVVNFSQFVVSPYDISSYFFLLLTIYMFLVFIDKEYIFAQFLICLLIFLATLNRESSALSVSMLIVLSFWKWGWSKKSMLCMFLPGLIFLCTYISLRYLVIDPENVHFHYLNAGNLTTGNNIMGLFFWVLFFFLSVSMAVSMKNKMLIVLYHLYSLPYIIVCLKDGVLWEVRLYIPLFLGSSLLAKLKPDFAVLDVDSKK